MAITAGSGTTISTNEETIASVAQHVQRVEVHAPPSMANGQVVPTATAATLVAARDTRVQLTLANHTNMDVFIGIATVTTSNGFKLPPGSGIEIRTGALIQLIVASATGLTGYVSYVETYS